MVVNAWVVLAQVRDRAHAKGEPIVMRGNNTSE